MCGASHASVITDPLQRMTGHFLRLHQVELLPEVTRSDPTLG
jgi:hypothetical protein